MLNADVKNFGSLLVSFAWNKGDLLAILWLESARVLLTFLQGPNLKEQESKSWQVKSTPLNMKPEDILGLHVY